MLKQFIEKLMRKENLNTEMTEEAFQQLLSEDVNPIQAGAFLALLRSKMETVEEMVGIIQSLRRNMTPIPYSGFLLDIVGTGGDNAKTINISTGAAILSASCGAKVAKHGNRAVSSLCGSADVLEKFGVNIELPSDAVIECIDEIGISFCFSPLFYPAMSKIRPIRKDLSVPTSFNLIGPLLNPANASHYLIGVYDENLMELFADVLIKLRVQHSLVVHGSGLDEITCIGAADAIEITPSGKKYITISPSQFGFEKCELHQLQGGDVELNAHLLYEVLSGEAKGPIADTLLMNAGIGLWLYGSHSTIEAGIDAARENLYSGKALELLKKWIAFSHKKVPHEK